MVKRQPKRVLHLTLEAKWFRQIAEGEKKVEYRDVKPYWTTRLRGVTYDEIHFRNGYAKNAPMMRIQWRGVTKKGRTYNIRLGKVLECRGLSRVKGD